MAIKDVVEMNRNTRDATEANRLEAVELVFKEMAKIDKESITGIVVGIMTNGEDSGEKPLFASFVGPSSCVAGILQSVTIQYLRTASSEIGDGEMH